MKIGSARGVRAGEAAPEMTKVESFFRVSCLAWPSSVSTKLVACNKYGTSGLGGIGPSYFSAADMHADARASVRAVLQNILIVVSRFLALVATANIRIL